MSFAVATMKKLKVSNLSGLQKHELREFKNHSNQDIDITKSSSNFDLINQKKINYEKDILNYIDQNKTSKRAIRKDAVVCDEWIISSDNEFFKNLSQAETKAYFQTSMKYFQDNFGKENVRYASVHLDETTPHMHMGIVPLNIEKDAEGKIKRSLSSKKMFDRAELKKIQTEFPQYMQTHGFAVERGHENSKRQKLSVKAYKDMNSEIRLFQQGTRLIESALDNQNPKQEKAIRNLERRSPNENPMVKLIRDFWQQLQNYFKKIEDKLNQREQELDKKAAELTTKELNLNTQTQANNEKLADLAINLGLDKSWKSNLIKNGGQKGFDKTTKQTVFKPFNQLIPELIKDASEQQLQKSINQINRNQAKGRGR